MLVTGGACFIGGTFVAHWMAGDGGLQFRPHRFHHVSTDEVYGSLGSDPVCVAAAQELQASVDILPDCMARCLGAQRVRKGRVPALATVPADHWHVRDDASDPAS